MAFGLSGAALGGIALGGATLASGWMNSRAARQASEIEGESAAAGMEQQAKQFEEIQKLLQPYVAAGNQAVTGLQPYANVGAPALSMQQDLLGLNGAGAQQAAIARIEQSPQFTSLVSQGENAIRQNASATGGLRGGNIQAALAQFRPQALNSLIEQTYSRLGGMADLGRSTNAAIAGLGQGSAASLAGAGQGNANAISNLLASQGSARAGGVLGDAAFYGSIPSAIAGGIGAYSGLTGLDKGMQSVPQIPVGDLQTPGLQYTAAAPLNLGLNTRVF